MNPVYDAAYYEDLAGQLYGLVIRLGDRLPADEAQWLHHVTEVGGYGLALDDMAKILAYGKITITGQERSAILTLAERMKTEGSAVPGLSSPARAPERPIRAGNKRDATARARIHPVHARASPSRGAGSRTSQKVPSRDAADPVRPDTAARPARPATAHAQPGGGLDPADRPLPRLVIPGPAVHPGYAGNPSPDPAPPAPLPAPAPHPGPVAIPACQVTLSDGQRLR